MSDKGSTETLLVTPGHPFYVPAKNGFIPVIDLKPGDRLQSLADGASENTSSEVESLELYASEGTTYNLTVDVGHTFYVGNLKTWVHNTGPCDTGAGKRGGTKSPVLGGQTAAQFEKSFSSLPPGERVAMVKNAAAEVAAANGMIKDNKLSRINGRDVYSAGDGKLYALDSQHGRFEVVNSKNGKHLGEVNFDFVSTKSADKAGRHDLKVK